MGVYIPGMELPMFCDDCWLCQNSGGANELGDDFCCIGGSPIDDRSIRPDWCPLVAVPPHGRTIDADVLLKKCEFVCTDDDVDVRAVRYSVIDAAPTIIPAEEGTDLQKEFMQNWHEEGE